MTSPWIVDTRSNDGKVYDDGPILCLPGIGSTTYERIIECEPHIITIKDLKESTNTDPKTIRGINKFIQSVNQASPSLCSYPIIDHHQVNNPYLFRYGETWEKELKKSAAMSPYVSITDPIMYMCNEPQRVMRGTEYEHEWYFYYDIVNFLTMK